MVSTGQGILSCNMFAYCENNPVSRKDDNGQIWNFVIGALVGALVGAVTTAIEVIREDGFDELLSGDNLAKIGVSAVCGATNGLVAASGAGIVVSIAVGGFTGAVETLGHELIDKDGELDKESSTRILFGAFTGMVGGAIAGKGAIKGNKYMERQLARFGKHIAEDGFKKSFTFLYKMTANYSKQFTGKIIFSIMRGAIGYKASGEMLKCFY